MQIGNSSLTNHHMQKESVPRTCKALDSVIPEQNTWIRKIRHDCGEMQEESSQDRPYTAQSLYMWQTLSPGSVV